MAAAGEAFGQAEGTGIEGPTGGEEEDGPLELEVRRDRRCRRTRRPDRSAIHPGAHPGAGG
jgi:hypothetical protein